jgi:hypothetical protein
MATALTLQLGAWNSATDTFVAHNASPTNAVIDLNDGVIFSVVDAGDTGVGLDWTLPQPTIFKASGPRSSTGTRVTGRVYDQERTVAARLCWGQGGSYASWQNSIHQLYQLVEGITAIAPAALKCIPSGGSTPFYLDVLSVYMPVPYEELKWLQLIEDGIVIQFTCKPFFRGTRLWFQNLVMNPGFEAPSGPGITAFNDPFNNLNAYSVQAGGALTQDVLSFQDVLRNAYGPTLLHDFRLDEPSGLVAFDSQATGNNGTISATGITYGTTGLLNGDSDTALTFASASSGVISVPASGLQAGNSTWSYGILFRIASLASAIQYFQAGGTNATKQGWYLGVSASNVAQAGVIGTNITGGGTLSTGTRHMLVLSWDGTTLQAFLDGASIGTATPGALNITYGSPGAWIGAFIGGAANFFNGILDEAWQASGVVTATGIGGTVSAAALWNAANTAPSTTSNTMLIPNGGREKFGTATWFGYNQWRTRFRFATGLTATFYAQYVDANNWYSIAITATAITISQDIAGTTTPLGTQAIRLINGIQYWLTVSYLPATNQASPIIITINNDVAGVIGSTVIGTTSSFVFPNGTVIAAPTALQIAASGATLGLGGNFNNVHFVSLFGPGAWTPTDTLTDSTYSTGVYAWEQTTSNTYAGGPVTSFGAGKMEIPASGKYNMAWIGGTGNGTVFLCPVNANDVIGVLVALKATGIVSGTQKVWINEYNSSGTFLSQTAVSGMSRTGNTSGYTTMSGTYTVGGSTAFVAPVLNAFNTSAGADAGGAIWWDNAQIYDQTWTGLSSMPYCELRFPQSPAQLVVSGIAGDVPAPTTIALGTYYASLGAPLSVNFALGRRSFANAGTQLYYVSGNTNTLDTTAFGGRYNLSTSTTFSSSTVVPLTVTAAAMQGVYHGMARVFTTESTLTNITGQVLNSVFLNATAAQTFAQVTTPGVPIFSAASTWTVGDFGQVNLPFESRLGFSGTRDLTKIFVDAIVSLTDTGSTTFRTNWGALLPVDGGIVMGSLTNPTLMGALTTVWPWLYIDGTNAPYANLTRSIETTSIANYTQGLGGIGTTSGNYISVISTGDPYLTVDPGVTVGGTSVNQLLGILSDGNGAVQPLVCDIAYSPLYAMPK